MGPVRQGASRSNSPRPLSKGFAPAEEDPTVWHSPGKFDPETGAIVPSPHPRDRYQDVFGAVLTELKIEFLRRIDGSDSILDEMSRILDDPNGPQRYRKNFELDRSMRSAILREPPDERIKYAFTKLTSKQADKAMELVGTWLFSTTQQSSENER